MYVEGKNTAMSTWYVCAGINVVVQDSKSENPRRVIRDGYEYGVSVRVVSHITVHPPSPGPLARVLKDTRAAS